MTDAQLLQFIYAHIGGERDSGLVKPMVLAMANLAYKDLAEHLINTDSELAKKLVKSLSNQTWANSGFSAPADMLFSKQKKTTRIDFEGVLAHQVEKRAKLDMVSGPTNHYYALEGKTFFIKHGDGTTSGTNLNITYYKVPTVTDIDDDLRNLLLEFLLRRLIPSREKQKTDVEQK